MLSGFTWLDWTMVLFISLVVLGGIGGIIWAVFFEKDEK